MSTEINSRRTNVWLYTRPEGYKRDVFPLEIFFLDLRSSF